MRKITRAEFLRLAGLAAAGMATGCGGGSGEGPELPPKKEEVLEEYKNFTNLSGDIHAHTNLSDGDESPDFALRYARDVSKLDFACVTDHAEPMADEHFIALPYYRSLPSKYDDPGKFCVLYGWEWTNSNFGHRNIYSLDNQVPVLPSYDPAYSDPEKLWNALSGYDVILIPHHPMLPFKNRWWDWVNPDLEWIVEFYSKYGLSLYIGNPRPLEANRADYSVCEALRNGRVYGLIASSDTHLSRPGSRLDECRPGAISHPEPGLVAVWAASHTRQAIFDALKSRRCYGTTGTRVNLQFTVNKAVMGASIQSSTAPAIAFRASSDVTINSVTITKIANGTFTALKTYEPNDVKADGTFTDTSFAEDASYMVRVDLANTDMALSSPVWVKKINS